MGLELDKPDFSPKDLNANWPLGAENLSQGDNHIRLTKKAMINFFNLYEVYTVKNENRFDNDKAKEALFAENSNKLGGVLWDQYALRNGDYANLRARATTKDDVELGRVDNFPTASKIENNSQKFTPVSLLYQLKNDLENTLESNKVLKEYVRYYRDWQRVPSQGAAAVTILTLRIKDPGNSNTYFLIPAGSFYLSTRIGAGVAGAESYLEGWIVANGDMANPLLYRKIAARSGATGTQSGFDSVSLPTSFGFKLEPGKTNIVEFKVKSSYSGFPGTARATIDMAGLAELFQQSNIVTVVE